MEAARKNSCILLISSLFITILVFQYHFNFFSCGMSQNYRSERRSQDIVNSTRRGLALENTYSPVGSRHCKQQNFVLFLKTHKTGSSTITNILNRFAERNNLTVLLPRGVQFYSFDWPNKFRLSSSVNAFRRPNFLINHSRYSRKSMNLLFPREESTYVSILRHPVSQWESTFQYMSFPYILNIEKKKDPMDFFLNNLPTTEKILELARKFPSFYLIRNPLLFDLGLDHKHFDDAQYIRSALKTLDSDFDLVLIMEYFDESLTLLRRRLCWDIDTVVNFKLNERLNQNKRRELSEIQIEKIKEWNSGDLVLYNFFLEKFWREVKNEGPGFYDDVAKLKKRRAYYFQLCIEGEAVEEAYSSVFVKGYKMRTNLTKTDEGLCEKMLRNELHYLDFFRAKRTEFISALEGTTIENFDASYQEIDIVFDLPDLKFTDYKYGRTKNPTRNLIPSKEKTVLFEKSDEKLAGNSDSSSQVLNYQEGIVSEAFLEYSGDASNTRTSTDTPPKTISNR